MDDLNFGIRLVYEVTAGYYQNDQDGWDALSRYKMASDLFFKPEHIPGVSIFHEQFWIPVEGNKMITGRVGYKSIISFEGNLDRIFKFPLVVEFFMDAYDSKKTDEHRYLVR